MTKKKVCSVNVQACNYTVDRKKILFSLLFSRTDLKLLKVQNFVPMHYRQKS